MTMRKTFIRQARLPKGAYQKTLIEVVEDFETEKNKKEEERFIDNRTGIEYCPHHPTQRWDRARFPQGCFRCYNENKR